MLKQTLIVLIAGIGFIAPSPLAGQGTPPDFREEFLRQFNASMSKFVALAEAMPAETYTWAPGEGVMPVAQVYAHVARYNYYYPESALGAETPNGVDLATMEEMRDKAAIVDVLRRSGEHVRYLVEQRDEPTMRQTTTLYGREVPEWSVLLQLLAHMNEHLGQSIAYARMNGVVPPWSR